MFISPEPKAALLFATVMRATTLLGYFTPRALRRWPGTMLLRYDKAHAERIRIDICVVLIEVGMVFGASALLSFPSRVWPTEEKV